jgi:nucleoid-associated protein YgaU
VDHPKWQQAGRWDSLNAHRLQTADHGCLGFHPSCPVCLQERTIGSLSSEPVISRRVQIALATGVLAFATGTPGAGLAAEPDQSQEGVTAPEQPMGGAPHQPSGGNADTPDFDPGGETALPFEVAPSPTAPGVGGGSEDTGEGPPVDSEPADDPDARLLATEPETQAPSTGADVPVPPVEVAPVPPPPPTPDSTIIEALPEDPSTPNAPSAPVAAPEPKPHPKESKSDRARPQGRTPEPDRKPRSHSETPAPIAPPQTPPIGVPPQSPAPASPSLAAAPAESIPIVQASAPAAKRQPSLPEKARSHVVEAGDSLWSIARRLLGRDASPGRIAREVNRLWELNEDRIGTGDPDLLMVGTRLRLR